MHSLSSFLTSPFTRRWLGLILVAIALVTLLIFLKPTSSSHSQILNITEADQNRTIIVHVGDTVTINLDVRTQKVLDTSYDHDHLEAGSINRDGKGSYSQDFTAHTPGTTTIIFTMSADATKTFTLDIQPE